MCYQNKKLCQPDKIEHTIEKKHLQNADAFFFALEVACLLMK